MSTSLQLSLGHNAVTLQSFKQSDATSRSFQARMAQLGGAQRDAPGRFSLPSFLRSSKGKETLSASRAAAKQQKQASMTLPFKAPVYRSYVECFRGIYQ